MDGAWTDWLRHIPFPGMGGLLEILVLSVVFYYAILFFRGTRGAQVLLGFVTALVAMLVLTRMFNLDTLNWILQQVSVYLVVAFVVIFQPEIRRALAELGKQHTVKILGDIQPGATMSGVGGAMARTVSERNLLPPGYALGNAGLAEMMDETVADFGEAILLAAFLTLLTLAAILESWSRPAFVLLTLPMGLIGVIWSLVLAGKAITMLVLLGMLMLIGIVVNAAILIVDQMARHLKEGICRREAMLTAMVETFRPVLMVILASGLGMLPMAIGTGIGSENRAGIGIASVAGVLVAGFLTLTVLPLIYTLFTGKPKGEALAKSGQPCED